MLTKLPTTIVTELRAIWHELTLVEWYSLANTVKSSATVIVVALLATLIISNLDKVIVLVRELLLNRGL